MILESKIKNCTKCSGFQSGLRQAPIIYIGENYKDVLLIGESPHKEWLNSGSPFYNHKGKLLPSAINIEKYLSFMGLGLDNVAVVEISKCVVIDRRNLQTMMNNCLGHLKDQIEGLNPKLVIVLGQKTKEAISKLCSVESDMLSEKKINGTNFIFLYHPSPINQNNNKRNLEYLSHYFAKVKR